MKPGCAGAPAASGIRGVADGPGRALAAGVHHEVGVAGRAPTARARGQAATAAVADVLHDRRQRFRPPGGQVQPARTGAPPKPAKVTSNVSMTRQAAVDRRERGREVVRAASSSVAAQNASRSAGTASAGA